MSNQSKKELESEIKKTVNEEVSQEFTNLQSGQQSQNQLIFEHFFRGALLF